MGRGGALTEHLPADGAALGGDQMGEIGDPDEPIEGMPDEVNREEEDLILRAEEKRRRTGHPAG